MKVILVRPPTMLGELSRTTALHHPIGLATLAAVLEKAGHRTEIVDYEVMPYDPAVILRLEPDVVGITSMTATIHSAYQIAARVKAAKPGVPVILGGVHATVLPERSLLESGGVVDAAVIGEGEERFPRLLEALGRRGNLAGLEGVAWRENGRVRCAAPRGWIGDLDAFPLPDRDKIRMDLYDQTSSPGFSRRFLRITEIFTSRGCPHDCIFCSAALLSGKRVRLRSLEAVGREMDLCIRRYRIGHFTISDDNFISSRQRALDFCDRVQPLRVTWTCESRVNTVDRGLLARMHWAGCRKISFGVEVATPNGLARVRKGLPPEAAQSAFAWAREAGIKRMAFFQVGSHPEETLEDIQAVERLYRRLDPDYVVVAIATPYPGTELRRLLAEKDLILSDDWPQYRPFTRSPCWRTVNFTPEQLVSLQSRLLQRFYLRPRTVLRHLLAARSPGELRYLAAAAISLLRLIGKRRNPRTVRT